MGVGHLIHYEVPKLAADAIQAFLKAQGLDHGLVEEPGTT